MFNKASLLFTADINSAIYASRVGTKVLYVGESMQELPECFIPCSILLPPFNALNAEIDGDIKTYKDLYFSYLNFNLDCFEMIGTMLAALYSGVSMTIYVENGNELSHMNTLIEYFALFHGIHAIIDKVRPTYAYDITFNAKNAAVLYNFYDGFMSAYTFLSFIPNMNVLYNVINMPYCTRTVDKIVQELQINPHVNALSVIQSIIDDMQSKVQLQAFIMTNNNGKKLSLVSFTEEENN